MRIDLAITELFFGGAERCLTQLAIGLQQRGHDVRVLSIGSLPQGDQAQLVVALQDKGVAVEAGGWDRPRQVIQAYWWLRERFLRNPPDLLQTMLYHANVLATWAAKSVGVPVRIGGMRVAERSRFRELLEARAIAQMDALVCVSDSVARFATSAFPRAIRGLEVIPNAIDIDAIDHIAPAAWDQIGWPNDSQVVLFVGRLHRQKGLDLLVEAIEPLLARYPEMRCCLVGEGPLRETLESVEERLGRDRFRLLGWRRDAVAMIKACRLLVLPSRYEGMPNVVLEAMAVGKPIAATRVEGVSELLGDNAPYQTTLPEDPFAFAALVEDLWVNPTASQVLAEQNRTRAVESFSVPQMVDRYETLYRSLLC